MAIKCEKNKHLFLIYKHHLSRRKALFVLGKLCFHYDRRLTKGSPEPGRYVSTTLPFFLNHSEIIFILIFSINLGAIICILIMGLYSTSSLKWKISVI